MHNCAGLGGADGAAPMGPAGHGRRPASRKPESSRSYRALGGRLQGCPLRGVRPRRWRCGCRARTALRSRRRGFYARRRDPPRGWSTGPSSPTRRARCVPSSSIMPSVLRGGVRAPPRAPRAGQGVRPPAAGADAVRGPRSAASEARPGPSCTAAAPSASDVWRRCRPCTRWRHCEQRRPADGPGRERLRFCGGKRMRSSKVLPFGGTSPREGMAAWRSE